MGAFEGQFAKPEHAEPQPMPLMADRGTQAEFPVDALGPLIGGAVRATVEHAVVPPSLAAQSALGACSLALQGYFNVQLPRGQYRPITLFLVTVAESGDRKSTSDDLLISPVAEFERELADRCAKQQAESAIAQQAWDEAKKAATHRSKNKGREALEEAYRELGSRPEGPLEPTIIVRTGTTQGLLKRFITTRPSLGLMSDEGGSWIGGYGMTDDNRLNTIATLSDFWDGKTVQMVTAGEGYTPLRGRRLTFHMMVQPIVASRLLGDAEAQGQGFLSRLLVTHPESLAGTRFVDPTQEPSADGVRALGAFHDRLGQIIRAKLPVEDGTQILRPRALPMSANAKLMWWGFYNSIEGRLGPDGDLQGVKGFVGKLPEQAARLAAILTAFERGSEATEIDAEALSRGIKLAEFYLSEAVRLFGKGSSNTLMEDAQLLSDWLRDVWPENLISVQSIAQKGPGRVRQGGDYIRSLVDILVRHEHLSEQLPGGGMVSGKKCRVAWRVQVRNG
jgi:hypothetical protein